MQEPLISVIIPIFKVEEYLERCINSITNQEYKCLEIILVDDGSPDACPIICDTWADKDNRIKVVHKLNGGLSDARNAGLKVATGDYISFIDGDDWVSTYFYSVLVNVMEHEKCDVVECDVVKSKKQIVNDSNFHSSQICYNAREALYELILDKLVHQHVWNKLYSRKLIENVLFPIGKCNEDEFWTYQVFGRATKIVHVNIPLYYYFQRSNSIMGSSYSLKRLDVLEAKLYRQKYIEKYYPELSSVACSNLYFSCMYSQQMALKYMSDGELLQANEVIRNTIFQIDKGNVEIKGFMDKVWYFFSKINFVGTCKLRNVLKIGF